MHEKSIAHIKMAVFFIGINTGQTKSFNRESMVYPERAGILTCNIF